MIIYTKDKMQHMLFDCKHASELFNVLDHAWREPEPQFLDPESPPPPYASADFIEQSMQQQMTAYQAISQYREEANQQIALQQQRFQKIPDDPATSALLGDASEYEGFLAQQQALHQSPLYPILS